MKNSQFSNPLGQFDNPKQFRQKMLGTYKHVFSGSIKESFLLSMFEFLENDPIFGGISLTHLQNTLNDASLTAINNSNLQLDSCKMIVMNHYFNTVDLDDYARGKLQESLDYKIKLKSQVIKMLLLQKLACFDFSQSSLEVFLPPIYYVSALTNYLANKYEECFKSNKNRIHNVNYDFCEKLIYKLILKIKSCISLADLRAIDELRTIFRTLIETFMSFVALWNEDEKAISAFYKHNEVTFNYNSYETKNKDFLKQSKELNTSYVRFSNYGWIRYLEGYKNLESDKCDFNLKTLSIILDEKCLDFCPEFGSTLYKIYKTCNPQAHATYLNMNYLELELHVFENIAVILKFISETMSESLFSFDFKVGDNDLFDELNSALSRSREIFMWVHASEERLEKTNRDYVNRAYCTQRMKK